MAIRDIERSSRRHGSVLARRSRMVRFLGKRVNGLGQNEAARGDMSTLYDAIAPFCLVKWVPQLSLELEVREESG